MHNESWARGLIRALIQQGASYFCCAPGSRSTPLALAIANDPLASHFIHFDERALAFHALGYAKATQNPAVIVVTSGTAVGNLLPAVMEAHQDRIPLILLTADRPPELRDCGANQTCDQVKIFASYIRFQVDFPCPEKSLTENYLSATIAHCVAKSKETTPGPVHINCMFREPLFSPSPAPLPSLTPVHYAGTTLHLLPSLVDSWAERLEGIDEGVILCGSDRIDYSEQVCALAEKLQWPIFADILSPLRSQKQHPNLILSYDPILKAKTHSRCRAIVQFGNRVTSKTLMEWINRQPLAFYLHVSEHTDPQDPFHRQTHRLHACPQQFCSALISSIAQKQTGRVSEWKEWDLRCRECISSFFSSQSAATEPGIFYELSSLIDDKWSLFLANSMPIRDANQFFSPQSKGPAIFGNRGVSGIDGNLATAVGIAQGSQRPTLAVVGDLTFLHDLNSLAQVKKAKYPVLILVVNNGGGGIFSFLPVAKREEVFQDFIASSHEIRFPAAAELFGIPYHSIKTVEQLRSHFASPCTAILEVATERAQNYQLHEHLYRQIAACLQEEIPTIPL